MTHSLMPRQGALSKAFSIVPYLTAEEVRQMANAMTGRHEVRDRLLIKFLFATGLRISEALSLTTQMIGTHEGKAVLFIKGKGNKPRLVACPDSFAYQLKSYAFDKGMKPGDRIFDIDRRRAWQIITKAGKDAHINKRIYPHLLRHSDAIERLRQTGNPKALQLHLGHSSMTMTMRYLSTLNEALKETLKEIPKKGEYVFVSPKTGDKYAYRSNLMKGLCKKAEVTVFNYHNLRHFGASFMASNSVPVTDIQTVLGHTEISTTSGYLQSLRQSLKESTESLQGIK